MAGRTRLGRLFPDEVATAQLTAGDPIGPLLEGEARAVQNAVPKRRWEFAAGRHGAREAMRTLGLLPVALPSGPDRVPLWPDEVVGSISHTDRHCVVALARKGSIRALGVDIERDEPLPDELWPMICSPTERTWLESRPAGEQGTLAKVFFSAKEAFYKCQYTLSRAMLDFLDVEAELDVESGTFRVCFRRPAGEVFAPGDELEGAFARGDGLILSGMTLYEPPR